MPAYKMYDDLITNLDLVKKSTERIMVVGFGVCPVCKEKLMKLSDSYQEKHLQDLIFCPNVVSCGNNKMYNKETGEEYE